jgi:hypothetical protein
VELSAALPASPAGDLYAILQKRKGQPLPEEVLLDW